MMLAMEREQTAYRSVLMVAGVVLADAEPMLTRLVRGGIALAVTASVPADPSSRRLADPVEGGELELSCMILAMNMPQWLRSKLLLEVHHCSLV